MDLGLADKAQGKVTKNPVIGEIQAGARAHIRSVYDDLFRELEVTLRDFDARVPTSPSTHHRVAPPSPDPARIAPAPVLSTTRPTVDCSVIRDPDRSRSLQARDENE
jgi:hypothetical protein